MRKLKQCSKNRQELFDNTILFFNKNNRGLQESMGCSYSGANDTACAIGREITRELALELDNYDGVTAIREPNIFNKLPVRLKRMGQGFLTIIQELHDQERNWNDDGLTLVGREHARLIAEKYKLSTSKLEKPKNNFDSSD